MGWLQRIFGMEKPPENAQVNPEPTGTTDTGETIPPERVGLNGEYDESGLAKRVALAFEQDSRFDELECLWVAQTGSTVVLKGEVPSQDILEQMGTIALGVSGATEVTTEQVQVG